MNCVARLTISIVVLFTLSGCALMVAGGAGAAGYAYYNGELQKSYPGSVGRVWPAVKRAVEETGVKVTTQSADDLGAKLAGEIADGRSVRIALEAQPNVTAVKIRVGTIGDRDAAQVIMDRIDQQLPTPAPEVHAGIEVTR